MRQTGHTLYDRLFKLARKKGLSDDDAQDAASKGVVAGLESGCLEWHFCSVAVLNHISCERRNRRRRNLDYEWTFLDGEDEPEEIRRWGAEGCQLLWMELVECVDAMALLPKQTQQVLSLKAHEWEDPHIALKLEIPITEVRWRSRVGRKKLRKLLCIGERQTKTKYTGVRRESANSYTAYIRFNGEYKHLGSFSSAREASAAYQRAKKSFEVNRTKPEAA